MPNNIREVVWSHRFDQEMQKIAADARRADEFMEGAEFVLSREPTIGTQIGNSHVWFLPVAETRTATPVVLYYTFDDEQVILLSIQRTQYPPKEE